MKTFDRSGKSASNVPLWSRVFLSFSTIAISAYIVLFFLTKTQEYWKRILCNPVYLAIYDIHKLMKAKYTYSDISKRKHLVSHLPFDVTNSRMNAISSTAFKKESATSFVSTWNDFSLLIFIFESASYIHKKNILRLHVTKKLYNCLFFLHFPSLLFL